MERSVLVEGESFWVAKGMAFDGRLLSDSFDVLRDVKLT